MAIGFSSPSHLLVGSGIHSQGAFGSQALLLLGNNESALPALVIDRATGQTSDILQIRSSNSSVSGDLLVVNKNGYVGINTSSPASMLDVAGDLKVHTTDQSNAVRLFTDPTDSFVYADFNNLVFKVNRTVDNFVFRMNTTDYVTIKGDTGNVGIGTTSPVSLLQVVGTGPTALFRLNRTDAGGIGYSVDFAGAQTNMHSSAGFTNYLGTDTSSFRIARASSSGRSQIALANETDSDIWRFGLTGGGGQDFAFYDGTDTVLFLNRTSNNVGIGTPTPQQTLNVIGTANITSNFTVGNGLIHVNAASNAVSVRNAIPSGNEPAFSVGSSYNFGYNTTQYAFRVTPGLTFNVNTSGVDYRASALEAYKYGTGAVTGTLTGQKVYLYAGDGSITQVYGFISGIVPAGGNISNAYGYVTEQRAQTASNVTNYYGFYGQDVSGNGINSYALYLAGGRAYIRDNVGIGTNNPSYPLHVATNTSGISAYFAGNISVDDVIFRSKVYNKSKGNATAYVHDASYYTYPNGTIDHSKFEYSEVSWIDSDGNTQQGYSLENEVALLRQALYEQSQKINNICAQNNGLKGC